MDRTRPLGVLVAAVPVGVAEIVDAAPFGGEISVFIRGAATLNADDEAVRLGKFAGKVVVADGEFVKSIVEAATLNADDEAVRPGEFTERVEVANGEFLETTAETLNADDEAVRPAEFTDKVEVLDGEFVKSTVEADTGWLFAEETTAAEVVDAPLSLAHAGLSSDPASTPIGRSVIIN